MSDHALAESPLDPAAAVFDAIVRAGEPWMKELRQGQTLRIVDLEGNQAVDTLRAQGNLYLTTGSRLLSSQGCAMLVITADTCGRHDTLGGACAAESNQVRYALDRRGMHNCRDNFLSALAQAGIPLSKRDLTSNINFFMNVPVTPQGGLTFEDGISAAGRYVEMRALMDVVVLVSNCPQLNNPCNAYNPTPVRMLIWD